jgi:hypothetical protein
MSRLFIHLALVLALTGLFVVPGAAAPGRPTFEARLTPGEEVQTPPVESRARGKAVVHLDRRGHKMHIQITVDRITDVIMAHLHLGPRGQNGGIVVDLYGADPAGAEKGLLLQSTITQRHLTGALTGMTMADLVEAIDAGDIYVNVHTVAYPGGEVRGQLSRRGRGGGNSGPGGGGGGGGGGPYHH